MCRYRFLAVKANSRGKVDCGDIDILITRPTDDGKTHAGMAYCILLPISTQATDRHYLASPPRSPRCSHSDGGPCTP